ncbi:MAG: protein tyrosine phosphatase [Myxococcota bacterium]|nr:protein tyrosine phosphatase [Myxococcota bacterium]
MIALLATLLLSATPEPASVFDLQPSQFLEQARQDVRELHRHASGLSRLKGAVDQLGGLKKRAQTLTLTPDEKSNLLSTWAAHYDYVLSAEVIRQRYWDYWKVPPTDPVKHGWGFLLTHAALTLELAYGLAFADVATGEKQLETLLDEPSAEHGLQAGTFSRFKERVVHVSTTTQLLTGDAYAKQLPGTWRTAKLLDDADAVSLIQQMRRHAKAARARLSRRGLKLFAKAALDGLADGAARAIFPVQLNVAEWMGDTRVHRKGRPLIGREQAQRLAARMEPGDILVARQNWYLSNIGLPGFWPHAELFLGRPEVLGGYFDTDPEVLSYVRAQKEGVLTFSELLARRFPAKWTAYQGTDFLDDPVVVLEAISEGVSFTGIRHAMMTDYLGVMRPRRSRLEKAKAMLRAFSYQGRPYDFDFDFFSDSKLVCTELVYKSYAPSKDLTGLTFPLVKVAGRMTLPANAMVRLFDEEYGRPDRQLDFVGFLDGREKDGAAVEADVEAFRRTHTRVKWDIAQE